ncbi:MAG TPA: hypothetical protein VGO47_11315 [Chlamydiales bacterium]|nr:hypothetical protein [Chlamydiales bacterium]
MVALVYQRRRTTIVNMVRIKRFSIMRTHIRSSRVKEELAMDLKRGASGLKVKGEVMRLDGGFYQRKKRAKSQRKDEEES